MVAEAEARPSAYRLTGAGLWSDRGSDVGNAQILAYPVESDSFPDESGQNNTSDCFWDSL